MAQGSLILNRYRPLGKAGSGGFGTVQVAWDERIQRKVAIKTIKLTELDAYRAALPGAQAVSDEEAARALQQWGDDFGAEDETSEPYVADDGSDGADGLVHALAHLPGLDEARTAAMLSDPRIVTVFDFEIRGRTAYLIMEYVEGMTLTHLLHDYADQVSLDVIAAVFDSVAKALTVAHDGGVLHLDIKPDNILINAKGQVKVTDFGLATLADAAGLGTTGGGTIGYMPLEQMRREHLDARTDEWSLASVTYEMITGMNPFFADSLDEAEGAIEDAELVLPSLCREGMDEEVNDVLFFALDPDRSNRYATVADFAEEMDKFLGDAADGQAQLAEIVMEDLGQFDDEEEEGPAVGFRWQRERKPRVPMSERMTGKTLTVLAHVFGAAASAFIGYIAASNMPAISSLTNATVYVVWGAAAVAGIMGAIKPHLGALISYALLAVAFVMGDSPVLGIVLLVLVGIWWFFVGLKGDAAANVALSLPVVGAIGGNSFVPLASGASLKPLDALATTIFACACAIILGSLGSGNMIGWDALNNWHFVHAGAQDRIVGMLMQPATWCMVGGWILCSLVQSACASRGTRASELVGLLLGLVFLVAGSIGAVWFDSGQTTLMPSLRLSIPIVVSAVVMLLTLAWVKPRK